MSEKFATNGRPQRSGKGGVPYFINQYKPPVAETDRIRLRPGQYLQPDVRIGDDGKPLVVDVEMPYIKFIEHFDGGRNKSCICSAGALAGYKDLRRPCRGCDIFWATCARNSEGRLESQRMSKQNKFALSIFDFGKYHKVEQRDPTTGQVKVSSSTKEPYFNWLKCVGQGCQWCRENKETKVGDARHWPMSFSDFQVIRSIDPNVGRSCARCGTVDCIQSLAWLCTNCGEAVIDMSSTTMTNKEILDTTDKDVTCALCQNVGLLTEIYECLPCSQRGQEGIRASVFDVDLYVTLVDVGNNKKILQVSRWSAPYLLGPEYNDIAKPVDLVTLFKPTPMATQEELFGPVPNTQPTGPVADPGTGKQYA
jgi:hypothetical protein